MINELENVIEIIRERINRHSNPKAYSEQIELKRATMYDFLNHGKGINVKTFFKIITPLGLRVGGEEVDEAKLIEVETVWCGSNRFKKGDLYKAKEILFCFGDASSSKQYMLLKGFKEGECELMIC